MKLARCQFHRVGNQTGKMPVPRLMPIPPMAQTAIRFTLSGVAEWE
ncbi:MAG: hypothetical protein F6J90_09640 [Moorea sp. SIOASIH]|nr:hypothetical protein [Moorena sp. SIOASIH]NEO36571.1 hypothetical protein [Moorena sp. SIOASIH]